MAGTYQLPNPNSPATNAGLTSLEIRQNFQSIQSQINNADGGALQAGTVTETALADAINPRLYRTQAGLGTFVVSGFSMSVPSSSLSVSLPSGIAYVNGYEVVYAGTTLTVAASQDTYIDLTSGGGIVSQGVANNATAPALAAGNLRLAKIVSGASAITSILQGSTDALSNSIYPTNPFSNGWKAFTPTWAASTTNPVIGNGSIVGRYIKNGRTVHFSIQITTGSTTTAGSGNYTLGLPVPTTSPSLGINFSAAGSMLNTGISRFLIGGIIGTGGGSVFSMVMNNDGGGHYDVSATSPFAFAGQVNNALYISGTYEAAN